MGKHFGALLTNLAAGLLLLGGPIAVAILARLQSIPWYLVALGVMAAPGIGAWSYLQVRTFLGLKRQTIERSGQIIRQWLDRTQLQVANSPTLEAYYRYTVVQGSHVVSVYRLKNDPEIVQLGINLKIPEADFQVLDSITSKSNSTLVKDLRIELARLGIQYAGLTHPLRVISFVDSIMFDQHLTRTDFLNRILFMFRAQVLLSEIIDREAKSAGVTLTMTLARPTPKTPAS